jgi:predicted ATP-grasp superfamily ATP-dependent carboligase
VELQLRVFVTDGNQRSSLAVVRSLGQAGVHVGVGDSQESTLAGSSRYCSERLVYPSPLREPERFQEFLATEMVRRGYEYLLATTDLTVQLVSALKPRLHPEVCVLAEDSPTLSLVQDKESLLELASKVGVETPSYVTYRNPEDVLRFAEKVGYPVVVKPRRSRVLSGGRWHEGTVRYAHTPQELLALCQSVHQAIPCPMVQEKLSGEGRGVFLLMWRGELKAAFCHRRLREKPPWGGVSVLSESAELDRELVDRSVTLLRAANWSGPAMVEFKNDVPGGRPKLMEVNGRFWGSLRLAIESGVDFPLLYLKLASGENVRPQTEYKTDIRSRWLLADLDALLTRLRASSQQEALYCHRVSRIKACADFLRPGGARLHYDVYKPGDAMPAWVELRQYLRTNLALALGRNGQGGRG